MCAYVKVKYYSLSRHFEMNTSKLHPRDRVVGIHRGRILWFNFHYWILTILEKNLNQACNISYERSWSILYEIGAKKLTSSFLVPHTCVFKWNKNEIFSFIYNFNKIFIFITETKHLEYIQTFWINNKVIHLQVIYFF